MAIKENVRATDVPAAEAVKTAAPAARLYFFDNLRVLLAVLVVLHHLALVYGGIQPFYYLEPPNSLMAFLLPMAFVLMNQAWFMGAFFLLAGYFTPGSFDRKGTDAFLKDKLIRLGIPLLVWYFVLNPIAEIGFFMMPQELTGITTELTWSSFWRAYPGMFGLGPLWFVVMLLVFNLAYTLWRVLVGSRAQAAQREPAAPGYLGIGIFILALAAVSFLLRIVIPLGKSVYDFPTLAYLPQYLSFFVVGAVAYRRGWAQSLSSAKGRAGFIAALLATVTLFGISVISFLKALEAGSPQFPPFGFGTWQSAVYALWDSIFAVGLVLAAVTFFRRYFNTGSSFGRFLSNQSYAVYILHIPVVVFTAYALRGIELAPLLKLGLASVIVLPVCFIGSGLIRKIPGVSKVL